VTSQTPGRPPRVHWLDRWTRYFFLVVGIVALGYVAYVMLDAQLFQAYENWRFERALKEARQAKSSQPLPLSPQPAVAADPESVRRERLRAAGPEGSPLGRIEISALGVEVMILEGVEPRTLQRAVGHIPGTALPGQQGNVALAGHRDTFFRALRDIDKDTEITLTTLQGSYRYRVDSTTVVEPQSVEVLADSSGATLTLVTCYPFDFIGHAPKRFIVRAHRVPG
jgi:sortase A